MIALVTGGASSGKSRIAEELCTALGTASGSTPSGRLVYLATMRPFGDEGARRVARHRAMREGKGFETLECYGPLSSVPTDAVDGATVLLEDLGNLVANALFAPDGPAAAETNNTAAELTAAISDDALAFAHRCSNLVIVGNEVGEDGIAYDAETQRYQEVLGGLSQRLAAGSDVVIASICGVPTILKAPAESGYLLPSEALGLTEEGAA